MQDNRQMVDLSEPTLKGCARCGGEHQITYRKFKKNKVPKYDMWAMCPVLDEPIMITIVHEGNEES